MKIFIVHKGGDINYAQLFKDHLIKTTGSEVLVLENGGALWKIEARQLIKQANLVLYIVGHATSDNVGWELKSCLKKNKPVLCLDLKRYEAALDLNEKIKPQSSYKELDDAAREEVYSRFLQFEMSAASAGPVSESEKYPTHKCLEEYNPFTKDSVLSSLVRKINCLTEAVNMIDRFKSGYYEVFNIGTDALDAKSRDEMLEQYKVYLETSEKLIERRQNVNNFYITVNAAMVTIGSLALSFSDSPKTKAYIMIAISVFCIVLDFSWIRILEAYGILNGSKMKIVKLIEEKLPLSLYDKEWDVMSDKLNNKRYVSFTDSEKRIPKIFLGIYTLILIICLFYLFTGAI